MPISFSELWEKAEQASIPENITKTLLYPKLQQAIDDYKRLDQVPSNNLRSVLQTKKMGEILYQLTFLSRTDNINTFAALQTEVQIAEKISQPLSAELEVQELPASFD